jgi:thiol-disulfide isomerase/thioredoxin
MNLSRRTLVSSAMAGLLVPLVGCGPAEPDSPPVDFTVNTGSGTFPVSDHRGEVVYIDFWATWCGPCRDSFPWMTRMQTKYREDGLKVIALSLDTDRELAREFAEELGANFTIGFDNKGEVADLFKVKGMPTSVLLDRKGRVVNKHEGFNEGRVEEYEASIVSALKTGSS